MTKFLITLFALASFHAFGQTLPNYNEFKDGALTNVPSVLTAGSTSNINAVVFTTPGHGIALFPQLVATNASTSNVVVSVSFARDRTLTNFTSTARLYTNALTGTTAIAPLIYVPVADCDATCAIRVNALISQDSTNTTTVGGINWSVRY